MPKEQNEKYGALFDLIRDSEDMEYSWYRRKDFVRHTGIVISFDGSQSASLDFYADTFHPKSIGKVAAGTSSLLFSSPKTTKKFVGSMKLKGKTRLDQFYGNDLKVVGRLIKLTLTTQEERENAMNMFNFIAEMDIGDYQPMENNCRNYVIAVATYLNEYPEMKGEDWSEFEYKMQSLLSEDHEIFQDVSKYALDYISKKEPCNEEKKESKKEKK